MWGIVRPTPGVGLLLAMVLTCATAAAARKPDLFVEGNTLRESSGGERRTAVGQYELGLGLRRRAFTVEYRHVARGREYRAQPGPHAYGALALTLHEF